jgi:hypothetical protein
MRVGVEFSGQMPMRGLMRVTPRGLLATLGTSGTLMAAFACSLLAISAFVGVKGWPGVADADGAVDALVVSGSQAEPGTVAGAAVASPPALVVDAPAAGAASAAADRARRPRSAAPGPSATAPTPRGTEAPAPAGAAAPAPAPGPGDGATPPGLGEPVRRAAAGVGQTVTATGDTVGTAVEPVSPALGDTVRDTTQAVGDTVGQTGRSVDAILRP